MKKLLLVAVIEAFGVLNASIGNPESLELRKTTLLVDYAYMVSLTKSCETTHNYVHYFNFQPTEADFQNILKTWNTVDCDGQAGGKITRSTSIY